MIRRRQHTKRTLPSLTTQSMLRRIKKRRRNLITKKHPRNIVRRDGYVFLVVKKPASAGFFMLITAIYFAVTLIRMSATLTICPARILQVLRNSF
jgi:hypothetical protein